MTDALWRETLTNYRNSVLLVAKRRHDVDDVLEALDVLKEQMEASKPEESSVPYYIPYYIDLRSLTKVSYGVHADPCARGA